MKKIILLLLVFFIAGTFVKSNAEVNTYRDEVLNSAGVNYIDYTLYKGKILRWNKAKFPINVFVENSELVPQYYADSFEKAALIWQDETQGLIKINFVESEDEADISFRISDEPPKEDYLAYTKPLFDDTGLKRMYVVIYKTDENGEFYPINSVLDIAVHEFGHALGIIGHNDDPTSIMYERYSDVNRKKTYFLDVVDRNTIRLLYQIKPDITNGFEPSYYSTVDSELLFR